MVVLGIRADFYARTASYPELRPYLQDYQVLVGPLDQAGLRAAIEKPAASAGLVVEAGLAELLMADLGLRPRPFGPPASPGTGAPWPSRRRAAGRRHRLAAATRRADCRCWPTHSRRPGRTGRAGDLTIAAYRATGGIDGAVAHAAEAVYQKFSAADKKAAQRLLLRLVSLGEGTMDTRLRVTMTELTGTTGPAGPADTPQALTTQTVLTDLVQARLLTADRGTDTADIDTDTGSTDTVEISHEALLSAWPRLRQWVTDNRASLRIHRDLTDAAHAWVEHPGFGGDSILPRCSGLGGRCLPRYRRLAEPRSDHFPLLFCRTSVQLRCPAAPPGGGLCRQAPAGGNSGISSSGTRFAPRVPRAGQG